MKKLFLLAVLMFCFFVQKAQGVQYDFTAICATGQKLYYSIIDEEQDRVCIVAPNGDNINGWDGFTKPTGQIELSETVSHNGTNYTVTAIGSCAFYYCNGLKGTLIIPNSVKSIGSRAFENCSGFTGSLNIPNSVESIGDYAFARCSGFKGSLTIPNSLSGEYSFAWSGFTGSLILGSAVTNIGAENFLFTHFSQFVAEPVTPPSTTAIFLSQIRELQSIFVPCGSGEAYRNSWSGTASIIKEGSFQYDLNVASSNPELGTVCITQYADCQGNRSIVTATPAQNCWLSSWTENGEVVSPNNNYSFFMESDHNLVANFYRQWDFSATCTTGQLLYYRIIDAQQHWVKMVAPLGDDPSGWGDSKPEGYIVLPQTVIHDGIEYVVTEIGDYAFYDCRDLRGLLNIPVTVTRIGDFAFYYKERGIDATLSIPDNVTSIGASAFKSRFIESIYIGNSVESIGSEALCVFDDTDRHVVSKALTPPDFEGGFVCMYNNPKSIYIHIPKNTLAAYQSAWGDQYNYIEMNDCVFRPGKYDMWSFWENWSNRQHIPELYDNVTIQGNCLLDVDATVSELRVAAGKTLTIGEGKTLTAVSIILENGAQLINNGTVNCGNVTVKKAIEGYYDEDMGDWNLVSSPVTASARTSGMATAPTGNYDLYRFSQTGDSQGREWLNYKAEAFGIENQSGYLYASKDYTIIVFHGNFAATEAKTLAYDADAEFAGFNLVGNPYPCNAYLADGRNFYRMNKSGTELIVESENPAIALCEGVFVQAHDTGESLRFTTSAPQGQRLPTVALTLKQSSGTAIDRAIVHLGDGGMLSKMMLNDNNTKLYIKQGGKDFAVVSTTAQGGEMPVNFKAAADGTYTLAMNVDNVSVKYLHIVDNLTGNDVDLLPQGQSYTFSAKATDDIARFKLVFSYNDVMEITANQDPNDTKHYYSTFYSSTNAYQVPEGVTAYTGVVEESASDPDVSVLNLTAIKGGVIPADEPVILKGTQPQIYLPYTTSTTATKSTNNALTGTDVAKTLGANDYALSLGQNGVGFYLWKDRTIDAHKAYLTLDDSTISAKAFSFQFDDGETMAIEQPTINGKQSSDTYNLNGVRVNDNYKGIVIKNGRKIYWRGQSE